MYNVHLQHFEGPLDLLVFFIQRDELDIYDIPIARIADEYLAYVRSLTHVDLDAAGEFVFFASLLISIKARMLLPTPDVDELGEPIDPRRELVERLLEYVRYKEASTALADLRTVREKQFVRPFDEPAPSREVVTLAPMRPVDLVRGLRRLLVSVPEVVQHAVERIVYTVEEQMRRLREATVSGQRLSFQRFVAREPRRFVIASLLAALELVRRGTVQLRSGTGADFWIEPTDDAQPQEI